MGRSEVWRFGEELAAAHLQRLGWRILDRNWRCPAGELDIVALAPGAEPTLVFCEVKCRTGVGFGPPLEAITTRKVTKLRQLAQHWLRARPGVAKHVRFDGVGVLLTTDAPPVLTHVQGIGQ